MITKREQKKSEIISFEVKDQIGILTINNGKQNKIEQANFLDLDYLKEWINEHQLKGLIIMGNGRHFSAGADVDNIKINKDDTTYLRNTLKKGKEILNYIESLPIVTVAAISGICFGGGLEIALSCQFRIASNNALFAFPESNLGIMPGLAGTIRLPRKIGKSKALEIIISARSVTVEEALQIGLIDKIVPNKEHLSSSFQFINELTENKCVEQIKSIISSINNSFNEEDTIAMDNEGEMFLELARKI